jgi:hypothetical protein
MAVSHRDRRASGDRDDGLKGVVTMTQRCLVAGALSLVALTLAACQSDAQQDAMGTAPGLASACIEDEAEALAGVRIDDAEASKPPARPSCGRSAGAGVTMGLPPGAPDHRDRSGRPARSSAG